MYPYSNRMLVPETQSERWHAVKSYRQRLILLEPENGWWIHAVGQEARDAGAGAVVDKLR